MKDEYNFSRAERGKFFRRATRLVPPREATARLFMHRGYQCVLLPDDFHRDASRQVR
jgi:hypothetical protein